MVFSWQRKAGVRFMGGYMQVRSANEVNIRRISANDCFPLGRCKTPGLTMQQSPTRKFGMRRGGAQKRLAPLHRLDPRESHARSRQGCARNRPYRQGLRHRPECAFRCPPAKRPIALRDGNGSSLRCRAQSSPPRTSPVRQERRGFQSPRPMCARCPRLGRQS